MLSGGIVRRSGSVGRHAATEGFGAIVLAAAIGLVVCALAIHIGGMPRRWLLFSGLGAIAVVIAILLRRPKQVLLLCWVVSLTYNRQFFSFEGLVGYQGSFGPYWMVSDVFLALLLALWGWQTVVEKRPLRPFGARLWPWLVPFLAACVVSVFAAEQPVWSLFELGRLAKVAVVLIYLRYNLGREEWLVCAVGLGLAVMAQSAMGTMEVIFQRTGFMWLLGGPGAQITHEGFRPEKFYGSYRAIGTMGHPPNLACYLVMVIPMFAATALVARRPLVRWFSVCVTGAGLIGVAMTLSRWPWLLMALSLPTILLTLCGMSLVSVKRAIAVTALAGLALGLTLMPFTARISERMTRDLTQSVDFRKKDMTIALQQFSESPLLGVGLSNYRLRLPRLDPQMMAWAARSEDVLPRQLHLRMIYGPLNIYLFVLAETGLLGALALAIAIAGFVGVALKAIRASDGAWRAAHLGIFVGLLAMLAQQLVDDSLWVDPVLFTTALLISMLNMASAAAGEPNTSKSVSDLATA